MTKFVLTDAIEFDARVEVTLPGGGKADFTARFRYAEPEAEAQGSYGYKTGVVSAEKLREALIGWAGVLGPDGKDIPFSAAARDRMLALPFVERAVLHAYALHASGAAEKN